jgi:hypothetical protein
MLLPLIFIPLALYWFAWTVRGRAVDQAVCRRCGYDLSWRSADSVICPECGANIMRFGAIRVGRKRSVVMLRASLATLAVLGGWLALAAVQESSPERLVRYKPLAWVWFDARTDSNRVLALGEIRSRVRDKTVAVADVAGMVNHALDEQADRARTWDPTWGSFVDDLHALGAVSNAQWTRYARQSAWVESSPTGVSSLHIVGSRRSWAPGIEGRVTVARRVGPRTPFEADVAVFLATGTMEFPGEVTTVQGGVGFRVWQVRPTIEEVRTLKPGRQEGRAVFDLTIRDGPAGPTLTTVRQAVDAPWMVPDSEELERLTPMTWPARQRGKRAATTVPVAGTIVIHKN